MCVMVSIYTYRKGKIVSFKMLNVLILQKSTSLVWLIKSLYMYMDRVISLAPLIKKFLEILKTAMIPKVHNHQTYIK